MSFAIAATGLAIAVLAIAWARRTDRAWMFFVALFGGLAFGAWVFHFTRVSGFLVAPPVILMLYLTPLRRIRYVASGVGGVALGVLTAELWAMLWS